MTKEYHELEVSEVPKPQVKDEEILVRVAAAGVNFVDLLYVGPSFLLLRFQFFEIFPSSEAIAVGKCIIFAIGEISSMRAPLHRRGALGFSTLKLQI